jgi:hypothetical protein
VSCALLTAFFLISQTSPAMAGFTVLAGDKKGAKAWQKAAEKTTAYKMYKYVPRKQNAARGRLTPDSGLTTNDVTTSVDNEIRGGYCSYYDQRNLFCSYQITDTPAAPKKQPKKKNPKAPDRYIVQITPQQAALMAVAELRLPAVAPGIGPDPSINRWKMAAVGYPLWLWADGPTHVGPVSQSVANFHVSLDARLTSVTYEMGDGHHVSCSGPGKKWTRSVEAGQASSCGYRYERPSLPKGSYTVRAVSHWSITWIVGGQSGVVPMDQEGTRQLTVGELQVLVR